MYMLYFRVPLGPNKNHIWSGIDENVAVNMVAFIQY